MQVEVPQHGQVTNVAECDVSELYITVYLGQLLRARLVLYFNRRLQDLKNTLGSYTCPLQLRVLLANFADRIKEAVDVEGECDKHTNFQAPLRYQHSSIQDRNRNCHRSHNLHKGQNERCYTARLKIGIAVIRV